MGCSKFYQTPVGYVRARTLAQTGEHYDPRSIEFKLISIYYKVEDRFRIESQNNQFMQWAYLVQAAANSGKVNKQSIQQLIEKTRNNLKETTEHYITPFKEQKDKQQRKEITQEDKVNFLETVGNQKFKNLSDILGTLSKGKK